MFGGHSTGVYPSVTRVLVLIRVSKQLVARSSALTSSNHRPTTSNAYRSQHQSFDSAIQKEKKLSEGNSPCKEKFPHSEEALATEIAVFAIKLAVQNLFFVRHPVIVPFVEGVGVVTTDVFDGVNFETGEFKLSHIPVERS